MVKLYSDKYDYECAYLNRWSTSGLDALIMPVTPWVGYKPWTWVKSHQYVGYTSVFNLLDWACLAMPVTKVSENLDKPVPHDWEVHQGRNMSDEFNKDQCE